MFATLMFFVFGVSEGGVLPYIFTYTLAAGQGTFFAPSA